MQGFDYSREKKLESEIVKWENLPNWRRYMAEKIAAQIDAERFGVKNVYLIGSAKSAHVGPGSDIDLIIHFQGKPAQEDRLRLWLEGWSRCLAEINYLKTGYASEGLLDVHFITDESIAQKTSFSVKIGAVTDAAVLLPMASSKS